MEIVNQIEFEENKGAKSVINDSDSVILDARSFSKDPQSSDFCLGLSRGQTGVLEASYYVGVSWIKVNRLSALVYPKKRYDYLQIFAEVLKIESEKESDYLSQTYRIYFEQCEIEVKEALNIASPIIMLHFLSLIKRIIKKGLKRGYIVKEDNLKSKIKGRILLEPNFKSNLVIKREDKCYCRYSEYTENISENRLLKRVLLVIKKTIQHISSIRNQQELYQSIILDINKCLSYFSNVSEYVLLSDIRNHSFNKVYKDYPTAINLAKNILKHFDYSLENSTNVRCSLPFWIDMSKLFELYVYRKLSSYFPNQILFQVNGFRTTRVDYLKISDDERLIIDAKYKPRYADNNSYILDDIGEISRYARDEKILNILFDKDINKIETEIPKCLIICPDNVKDCDDNEELNNYPAFDFENNLSIWEKAMPIRGFKNFRKIKIALPIQII